MCDQVARCSSYPLYNYGLPRRLLASPTCYNVPSIGGHSALHGSLAHHQLGRANATRGATAMTRATKGRSISSSGYGTIAKKWPQQYAVLSYAENNPTLVDAALDTIAAAFQEGIADDPVMRYLGYWPDCDQDLFRKALTEHMKDRHREREIVSTLPPAAAALVTMYPASKASSWWNQLMRRRAQAEGGWTDRTTPERKLKDMRCNLDHGGRFLHISALGVCPELQGRGLGSGLLAWVCGRADAVGLHCVAEASSERAKRMLQREGFRTVQCWSAHGKMPYLSIMIRPPCPATVNCFWVAAAALVVGPVSALVSAVCSQNLFLRCFTPAMYGGVLMIWSYMCKASGQAEIAEGVHPWAWSEPRAFLSTDRASVVAVTVGCNALAACLPLITQPKLALAAAGASGLATALVLAAGALVNRYIWHCESEAGRLRE